MTATGEFNPRVVTLRVTGGEFFPGGGTSIVVPLDETGRGSTALRPPVQPGTVIITATAGSMTVSGSVEFVSRPKLLETLTVSDTQPFADEATQVRLEARLTEAGKRAAKRVTFRTTAGKFSNGAMTIEVDVDQNGIASTVLTAPGTAQRADVWVEAAGEVARNEINFRIAPPWLISLRSAADSLPADGASVTTLTLTRDPAAAHIATAEIEASEGAFLPGSFTKDTVAFDAAGRGVVVYRAGSVPRTVIFRATRGQQTLIESLRLVPAHPDALSISGPAQTNARLNETLTFTSRATRAVGTTTRGLPVRFAAHRQDGSPIGTFLSIPVTDDAGGASVGFVLNDTTYTGQVTVTARMRSASGDSTTATHILRVVKP